jgi:hypothetical protein
MVSEWISSPCTTASIWLGAAFIATSEGNSYRITSIAPVKLRSSSPVT